MGRDSEYRWTAHYHRSGLATVPSNPGQESETEAKNLADLQSEVSSFAKEFPEIKLDRETDVVLQDGRKATLEQAIMLFGYQNRIPDFESAALKYLKPELLSVAQSRARTETVKAVKQDKQQGVIARSSTPSGGQSSKVNPKASWSEVNKSAKAELESLLRG